MDINDFLRAGRLNSRLTVYKRRKERAIAVCRDQLATHENPYIALSGGKDSVAMAFIVNEALNAAQRAKCTLWSHISDASFPETLEVCRQVSAMTGIPLYVYQSKKSAFEYVNEKKKRDFGKTGVFFDSVREYASTHDLAFVGVRANESARRMKAAKLHGMTFHSHDMGDIDIVNPLQWFSIYDVFSVLDEYGAPIHPIYFKFPINTKKQNTNKEPQFIRLGYITAKDLMDRGTVLFIKTNYPDIYQKLIAAYPDAQKYT